MGRTTIQSRTLHFYTTGEGLTNLLLELFQSGEFDKFEKILKEGNLGPEQLYKAFHLQMTLTGSTKDGGELECHFNDAPPKDFPTTLYFAILTAIRSNGRYDHQLTDLETTEFKEDKNTKVILKYFTVEEIYKLCWQDILTDAGFEVTTLENSLNRAGTSSSITGLLLQTGEFIQCGYQQHINLWPIVCRVGKANGDSHHDSDTIVISSNQLLGSVAYSLYSECYSTDKYLASDSQIRELWKVREYNLTNYSARFDKRSINSSILKYYAWSNRFGGKHGNLTFLKTFYPEIEIVEFSTTHTSPNLRYPIIVRTSPDRSLPGLLHSIKVNYLSELTSAVDQIKTDFEVYKETVSCNKLNWFYQNFIEGKNGVVNCIEKPSDTYPKVKLLDPEYLATLKYDINIACSNVQGAIVEGHMTNVEISDASATYLRRIARILAVDFQEDVQLEFVITPEDKVIIVQLRLFENTPNRNVDVSSEVLKSALVIGKTFCSYKYLKSIEVAVDEILIVEQDCESEALIGKKALIVENDTNFSHILALSKALSIPSIYGTGKVNLDGRTNFIFNTEYSTGYIK